MSARFHALCEQIDNAVEMYQDGQLLITEFALIVSQLNPELQAVGSVRVTTETGLTYIDAPRVTVWN